MTGSYELADLLERRRQSGQSWLEFLRVRALSMGLYVLPKGASDPQQPHTEDEVYYIVSGHGVLQVGDEDLGVAPGTLLFVPAKVAHRFDKITEDLTALVFFAPASSDAPLPNLPPEIAPAKPAL